MERLSTSRMLCSCSFKKSIIYICISVSTILCETFEQLNNRRNSFPVNLKFQRIHSMAKRNVPSCCYRSQSYSIVLDPLAKLTAYLPLLSVKISIENNSVSLSLSRSFVRDLVNLRGERKILKTAIAIYNLPALNEQSIFQSRGSISKER